MTTSSLLFQRSSCVVLLVAVLLLPVILSAPPGKKRNGGTCRAPDHANPLAKNHAHDYANDDIIKEEEIKWTFKNFSKGTAKCKNNDDCNPISDLCDKDKEMSAKTGCIFACYKGLCDLGMNLMIKLTPEEFEAEVKKAEA